MATVYWVGGAAATAQVNTYTFAGTWEVGDLIRVTIGSKVYDYAVTSTTIATFLPLFVTAFNALDSSLYPEFVGDTGVTASATSPVLTLTANTEGVPFTVTLTPLESDGSPADLQTIEGAGVATTGTAATASAGPEDWSTAKNWSGGAVPVNTNDVIIDRGEWSIRYGLSSPSAVDLASLKVLVQDNQAWEFGLPVVNKTGTAYPEYRTQYLTLGTATALEVRTVSALVKLNVGSNACTAQVYETGQGTTDTPALLFKGTNAANVVNVSGTSDVGIAWLDSETATVATLRLEGDCTVRCGSGTTLTTVNVYGGNLEVNSAVTTYTVRDGTVTHRSGAVTTANLTGSAALDYRSSGTLGALNVGSGASVTFDNDPQARTVSTCDMWAQASLSAENGTVTWSAGIDLNQCTIQDVSLNLQRNIRLTIGAPA